MTYSDWLEWKDADAIETCSAPVRERLQRFVQSCIVKLVSGRSKSGEPERRPLRREWQERCREWTDDTSAAWQKCGSMFDAHMMRGRSRRYKDAMFSKTPTESAQPSEKDYAAAWTGYAEDCVRSAFHEELRKEIIFIKTSRRSGVDSPQVQSFSIEKHQGDDEDESCIQDTIPKEEPTTEARDLLAEVHHVMDSLNLGTRDQLLVWGAAHRLGRTSSELCRITGVEKSVLSSSFRNLEDRIVKAVAVHFQRTPPARAKKNTENSNLHHGIILGICWDYLLGKYFAWTPEKGADGSFNLVPPDHLPGSSHFPRST